MVKMFHTYVLKSTITKKSYVGATNDIARRLSEHNSGKHAYTKRYAPWVIIYSESFQAWGEAREKEKYLKSSGGRRFLKKIFDSIT